MTNKIKGGLITALITPFKNDKIDFESLEKLIHHQVQNGVEGFVISGTTAESPNLEASEVEELFKFAREKAPDDIQMILGAGSNSTKKTIDNMKAYNHLNVDAYLMVTPYYNKPTQSGIFEHFKAISQETDRSIVLYDVPGRTVVEISVETTAKLAELNNIIGIKDATGDLEKFEKLKEAVPNNFTLLSGDDDTAVEFIKRGGHGVISVLSHVVPKQMRECWEGQQDFTALSALCGLLFKEPNPTPVKHCLKQMGLIEDDSLRLPLLKVTEELGKALDEEMKALELFNG